MRYLPFGLLAGSFLLFACDSSSPVAQAEKQKEKGDILEEDDAAEEIAVADDEPAAAHIPEEQGVEPAASAGAGAPDAQLVGSYGCTEPVWDVAERRSRFNLRGSFQLNADGTYSTTQDGRSGTYAYDPATGNLTFTAGYFGTTNGVGTLQGEQIDITFGGDKNNYWTCGKS